MNLDRVSYGNNAPEEINVIIEIPAHSDPVKYEVDKETGAMFVDRFMNTAMHYPCNYGYIPNTLSTPCLKMATRWTYWSSPRYRWSVAQSSVVARSAS